MINDESQRAMVAAKLAKLPHGGDRRSDQAANLPLETPTQTEAANILNVSERSVRSARDVHAHGAPELVSAVEAGEATVSAAAEGFQPAYRNCGTLPPDFLTA
jgi:hypothetical protein